MFISWTRHHGRSEALAGTLGIPAEFVAVGHLGDKTTVVWRHAVQALRTARLLRRHRPPVLVVMAPPLPLVLIGLLHQRLTGRPLVIDAHTGAVLHDDGRPRRLFLRLSRRARATVVTTETLQRVLARHGTPSIALHDPPFGPPAGDTPWPPPRPMVVMPSSWWRDEPLDVVRDAARLVPDIDLVLTGTPKGPLADPSAWPDNVRLAGWLDDHAYRELIVSATALLALTTREHTMQRAGYEALILGRPVVVSATEVLRDFFTQGAVVTGPTAEDLAAALRAAVDGAPALAAAMAELRTVRQQEFEDALDQLRRRIEPPAAQTGVRSA